MSKKDVKKRRIQDRWMEAPSVNECLPYVFKDGVRLTGFELSCPKCNRVVDPVRVHGVASKLWAYVVGIQGVAVCAPCQFLFEYSIRAQSTSQGLLVEEWDGQDWQPIDVQYAHVKLWRRIVRWWDAL